LENKLIKKWQVILLPFLLIGIIALNACSSTPKAKNGDTVKVDYTLTLEDGTVYDSTAEREPFEFTLGNNEVITGFEEAVKGMKVGQTKKVTLTPDKAYGEYYQDLLIEVDRSQLPAGTVPTVGQSIIGQSADGTSRTCIITAVADTTVTVDCNVPLAGKTLTFEITLVEIVDKE
jgi:peptidylprolyl isomerase